MLKELSAAAKEAIEIADAQVNNFGLPTYSDLLKLAQMVAEGIPRNTVSNIDRARKLLDIDA